MMTGFEPAGWPATVLMLIGACLLDRILGEPNRWHP